MAKNLVSPSTTSSSQPLILVVDDEPLIRYLLCEVLESEQFVTEAMENADQAIEFLKHDSARVSLLITDINMPGVINGAELANSCRELWPRLPIIVMSGFESLETAKIRENLPFFQKPFAIESMLAAVRRAIVTRGLT